MCHLKINLSIFNDTSNQPFKRIMFDFKNNKNLVLKSVINTYECRKTNKQTQQFLICMLRSCFHILYFYPNKCNYMNIYSYGTFQKLYVYSYGINNKRNTLTSYVLSMKYIYM